MEEYNFKQYRYINELSKQIEDVEDYNRGLEEDKKELEDIESRTNLNRKDFIKVKEIEMQANFKAAEKTKAKTHELESEFKDAVNELENLFYYLEIDKKLDKYSKADPFDIKNVGPSLGMIESHQDELMYLYNLVMSSKKLIKPEMNKKLKSDDEEIKIKKIGDLLYNAEIESDDMSTLEKKLHNYEEFKQSGLQKIEKIKLNMKLKAKKKA